MPVKQPLKSSLPELATKLHKVEADTDLFTHPERNENAHAETLRVAIEQIFSDQAIQLKSNLNARQLQVLVQCAIFASKYESEVMALLVSVILKGTVSVKARGRDDLVKALQSVIMGQAGNEFDGNRKQRLHDKLMG